MRGAAAVGGARAGERARRRRGGRRRAAGPGLRRRTRSWPSSRRRTPAAAARRRRWEVDPRTKGRPSSQGWTGGATIARGLLDIFFGDVPMAGIARCAATCDPTNCPRDAAALRLLSKLDLPVEIVRLVGECAGAVAGSRASSGGPRRLAPSWHCGPTSTTSSASSSARSTSEARRASRAAPRAGTRRRPARRRRSRVGCARVDEETRAQARPARARARRRPRARRGAVLGARVLRARASMGPRAAASRAVVDGRRAPRLARVRRARRARSRARPRASRPRRRRGSAGAAPPPPAGGRREVVEERHDARAVGLGARSASSPSARVASVGCRPAASASRGRSPRCRPSMAWALPCASARPSRGLDEPLPLVLTAVDVGRAKIAAERRPSGTSVVYRS